VALELLASRFPTEEEPEFDALAYLGIPVTGAALVAYALIKKCAKGDVSGIKLLLELVGETEHKDFGANLLGEMSDAELLSMLGDLSLKNTSKEGAFLPQSASPTAPSREGAY
jgi:hypothetical protein